MERMIDSKVVEIQGRKFRIAKFDAMTGSFMLMKVMNILAPVAKGLDFGKLTEFKDTSNITEFEDISNIKDSVMKHFDVSQIIMDLTSLSEQDFRYIQERCLKVCSEVLPAGDAPVLLNNGEFGVVDLKTDTMTVLALTAHALIFNVSSFFAGSPLSSMFKGILTTFQQDTPT